MGYNNAPTFSAGDLINYTISVENPGPSEGKLGPNGISDAIPAGTTFHSFAGGTGILTGGACSIDAGLTKLTCLSNGVVPAGTTYASNSVTLILKLNLNYSAGNLSNTVSCRCYQQHSCQPGRPRLNQSSTVSVNTVREPDLAIDKTGPAFVKAGEEFIYTLKLTNNGPSVASPGVEVKDTLPAGLTYIGTTSTGAGAFNCIFSSPNVTCTSTQEIVPQAVTTFSVRVKGRAGVTDGANIRNLVAVKPATGDVETNTSNNNDEFTSIVTTGADLQITKVADRTTVISGTGDNLIRYMVVAQNNGRVMPTRLSSLTSCRASCRSIQAMVPTDLSLSPLSSFSPGGSVPPPPMASGEHAPSRVPRSPVC
ncbi:MAG: DUF11 domain-containing protein [Acidobacteria bacterium]|nr:DUF11 domain-containing protein [Acidobacteriota bacterium]